ncbi:hypothetical protein CMV30_07210 [Nibricoccus aquaticus]|uniref:Uncharacterized protein n=1 Tax=Nibricoccus aquaticus TaxID=2576891 RepID=A0A290QBZ5_9BACT|nr:hypothetical protein [Nibricoccus aquaticus]ATC63756.1 hypothetical protein CMV30_07210 [Nibricoccus aquaticus]
MAVDAEEGGELAGAGFGGGDFEGEILAGFPGGAADEEGACREEVVKAGEARSAVAFVFVEEIGGGFFEAGEGVGLGFDELFEGGVIVGVAGEVGFFAEGGAGFSFEGGRGEGVFAEGEAPVAVDAGGEGGAGEGEGFPGGGGFAEDDGGERVGGCIRESGTFAEAGVGGGLGGLADGGRRGGIEVEGAAEVVGGVFADVEGGGDGGGGFECDEAGAVGLWGGGLGELADGEAGVGLGVEPGDEVGVGDAFTEVGPGEGGGDEEDEGGAEDEGEAGLGGEAGLREWRGGGRRRS